MSLVRSGCRSDAGLSVDCLSSELVNAFATASHALLPLLPLSLGKILPVLIRIHSADCSHRITISPQAIHRHAGAQHSRDAGRSVRATAVCRSCHQAARMAGRADPKCRVQSTFASQQELPAWPLKCKVEFTFASHHRRHSGRTGDAQAWPPKYKPELIFASRICRCDGRSARCPQAVFFTNRPVGKK